jgi:hypothetical protein
MIKTLQTKEEQYIQFTDEELKELGLEKDTKFTVEEVDGSIKLTPYKTIEFDLSELDRDILEFLVKRSCETHMPVEDIINDILKWAIDNKHLFKKND